MWHVQASCSAPALARGGEVVGALAGLAGAGADREQQGTELRTRCCQAPF